MKLKILAIVALAAVGVGAAFVAVGGLPASAASKTQYLTGAATTGDVADDVAATGTVATSASYGLAFGTPAHLAGADAAAGSTTWTVTDLKVAVGDTVKKGDVLATADTTDLKRQLAAANTAVDTAKIQLRLAKASLTDAEDAAVTAQIRQAKVGVNNATSQLADATKTRDDVKTQIRLATLTAPIDGIVTAVNVVKGLEAPSGDAIVVDATTFQVTADVVESDLASMKVGQTAAVTIGAVDATGDRQGHRDRPDRGRQHDRRRRLVRGHRLARQRARDRARRDDRRRHDHHRQRDERPDRPGRGPARDRRQLLRPDPGRRRHPDRPAGRGRPRHEHHRRDQERPDRGPGGRDRRQHAPDRDRHERQRRLRRWRVRWRGPDRWQRRRGNGPVVIQNGN